MRAYTRDSWGNGADIVTSDVQLLTAWLAEQVMKMGRGTPDSRLELTIYPGAIYKDGQTVADWPVEYHHIIRPGQIERLHTFLTELRDEPET